MATARTPDAFAESLAAELRRAAAECPQRPFIRMASGEWSYAQIDDMSDRVAAGLHAQGVRRGDNVSLMLPTCIEFAALWFALAKLGAVTAPVHTAFKGSVLANAVGIEDPLVKPVSASLMFDSVIRTLGRPDAQEARSLESAAAAADLGPFAGRRMLLVEDNELNQEVATELLKSAGFVVELADNGAIALEKVRHAVVPYAVILMDMQMPVMDGLDATREIRKLPQCADLPIVAMTANAMGGDRDRCLDAGMNDHVAKPIDPEQLWRTLAKWIKPRSAAADMAPARTSTGTAAEMLPLLAPIAGLDMKQGLQHALGRPALYVSLLRKFVAGQREFPAQLGAALEQADWQTAERLAHTLKGLAAQIGAAVLHSQAGNLELAIRQRDDAQKLVALRTAVSNQLTELIDSITSRLPLEAAMPETMPVDAGQLQALCTLLAAQLTGDDFTSGDTVEAGAELLRAALGAYFEPMADAVHNFNFASALDLLRKGVADRDIRIE